MFTAVVQARCVNQRVNHAFVRAKRRTARAAAVDLPPPAGESSSRRFTPPARRLASGLGGKFPIAGRLAPGLPAHKTRVRPAALTSTRRCASARHNGPTRRVAGRKGSLARLIDNVPVRASHGSSRGFRRADEVLLRFEWCASFILVGCIHGSHPRMRVSAGWRRPLPILAISSLQPDR